MTRLRSTIACSLTLAASVTIDAHAADHLVALSAPWPSAAELAPGDRILLEPGLHDARAIRDWPGTFGMPIVITSANEDIPSGIVGLGSPALVARDCGGLRLERLLVVGDGLDLGGRGRDTDSGVTLQNVQFLPSSRDPAAAGPAFGVRISDAGRAVIDVMGVQRYRETGITLDRVGEGEIRNAGLTGGIDSPVGIRIDGCRRVSVTGGGIVGGTRAGVLVAATDGTTEVRLEGMVFQRTAAPVRIEGPVDLEMNRCTIVSPARAVVEIADPPKAPGADGDPAVAPSGTRVRLDRCLVTWTTGGLSRLFGTPSEGPAPTIELGRNLWWSPGLEAEQAALGGFPDAPEAQRIDLDPRLVPRTWLPSAEPAKAFGHGSRPSAAGSGRR